MSSSDGAKFTKQSFVYKRKCHLCQEEGEEGKELEAISAVELDPLLPGIYRCKDKQACIKRQNENKAK